MSPRLRFEADLAFSVEHPVPGQHAASSSGTLTASGSHLTLHSDDVARLSTAASGRTLSRLAADLAGMGLSLSISGPQGVLVTLGAVRPGLVHRIATRSRNVRVEHWRRAWRFRKDQRREQRSAEANGTGTALHLPPPTPSPIAPTFRYLRRPVTTTHDPLGGGRPQLVLAMGPAPVRGAGRKSFRLRPGATTIGSGADADLRLQGLERAHARIVRDADDEYVLVATSDDTSVLVNGAPTRRHMLRSGTRIQLGSWRMTYWRDEHADHGRPYGGREGGELSHQRGQTRPDYRSR